MSAAFSSALTFAAGILAYGLGCSVVSFARGRRTSRHHRDTDSGWCE
jgi:hypothetical protein